MINPSLSASQALDLNRPESQRIQTVAIKEIPFKPLKIRPILANSTIYLDLSLSTSMSKLNGQIINLLGQPMQSFSFPSFGEGEVAIPITQLERGIYIVRFRKDASYYQGRFMKL